MGRARRSRFSRIRNRGTATANRAPNQTQSGVAREIRVSARANGRGHLLHLPRATIRQAHLPRQQPRVHQSRDGDQQHRQQRQPLGTAVVITGERREESVKCVLTRFGRGAAYDLYVRCALFATAPDIAKPLAAEQ